MYAILLLRLNNKEIKMERKKKMIMLKESGLSYQSIADLFNISRARVHQIISGYRSGNTKYRKVVFIRDGYKCQWGEICKNSEVPTSDLVVHHIDFNSKNNNYNNLITLCRRCHAKFHSQNHIEDRMEKKFQAKKINILKDESIADLWKKNKTEITMEDLADMFNLSTGRVCQILKEARAKKDNN